MALGEQGRLLSLQRTAEGRLDRRFFTAAHCGIYFTLGFATARPSAWRWSRRRGRG